MPCQVCVQRQHCIPWQIAHHDRQVATLLQEMAHCEIGDAISDRPQSRSNWLQGVWQGIQLWATKILAGLLKWRLRASTAP